MKKRSIALLLALALVLSLCAVTAAAGEKAEDKAEAQTSESAAAENGEAAEGETGEATEEAEEPEPPSLAGPDSEPETDPETGEAIASVLIEPDALGTVSFANVERRMRENNLQILALQGNIDTIEDIDYDKMYEDLRKQLNQIAQGQWMMIQMGQGDSYAYTQMEQGYDAVREKFDAIKDGDMQKDNADLVRQLKNLQDQIVVAGESTYIALQALEVQEGQLQRQLAALNRTV